MSTSLDYRRDTRSVEKYEQTMKTAHAVERCWAEALQLHMGRVKLVDLGVDNSGELIEGKLDNHNADYLYEFDSGEKIKVEIKTIPEGCQRVYMTFKSFCLDRCEKDGSLVVVPTRENWYAIGNEGLKRIKAKCPSASYGNFADGKPSRRVPRRLIDKMIEEKIMKSFDWKVPAKAFVELNWDLLKKN